MVVEAPVLAVVLGLLLGVGVGGGRQVGVGGLELVDRGPDRGDDVGLGEGHEQRHGVGRRGQLGQARRPSGVEVVGPREADPTAGYAVGHPQPVGRDGAVDRGRSAPIRARRAARGSGHPSMATLGA